MKTNHLSSKKVLELLTTLAKTERLTKVKCVALLSECIRRKLYLDYGYPTLYKFTEEHLCLSSNEAYARCKVAELCFNHPSTLLSLERGDLSLSAAFEIQKGIDAAKRKEDEEKEALLREKERLKSLGVEVIPKKPQKPTLSKKSTQDALIKDSIGKTVKEVKGEVAEKLGGPIKEAPKPARPIPVSKKRFEVKISLDLETEKKAERLKDLWSRKVPNGDWNKIFELMLEECLEKHAPERKENRIIKRKRAQSMNSQPRRSAPIETSDLNKNLGDKRKRTLTQTKLLLGIQEASHPKKDKLKSTLRKRHIPVATRRKVFTRDKHECQYHSKITGKKCGSKRFLDIDHIKEFSKGGVHSEQNLRVYCSKHNRNRNRARE